MPQLLSRSGDERTAPTKAERAARNDVPESVEGVAMAPEKTDDFTYLDYALMAPNISETVSTSPSADVLDHWDEENVEPSADASAEGLVERKKELS